jgi:hypothetical protein
MENSSQTAWKLVPLRHFFPLKVVPLIEVLLYLPLLPLVWGMITGSNFCYLPDGN